MTTKAPALLALGLAGAALSSFAALAAPVPGKHIPPAVLMELRVVESQFQDALRKDCAPERCYVNGCAYEEHLTLDQPEATSLPGLPAEQGPGSVKPQQYLTRARCEFSHEKSVPARDVERLARRLEKRLSRGWLTVVVSPQALDPIPKSLSEPPKEPEEKPKDEPKPDAADEDKPPAPLTVERILQELWSELLPHSPWVLALLLLTLMTLILIWAGRRLGAPSLEDKMLEAQLASQPPTPVDGTESEISENIETRPVEAGPSEEEAFVDEQEALWKQRLEHTSPEDPDDAISRLLREWLKSGDYGNLARALLIFGDRVSVAFETMPELALKKVEFASYFRDVDEADLPSRASFYRHLNQQAMASLLLTQDDVQLYRALREDFGTSGFVSLMRQMPERYAALLYALVDMGQQQEIALLLDNRTRFELARELLSSTRISMSESRHLAACLQAVQDGPSLPEPPEAGTVKEHGAPLDSAGALSVLLTHLASQERLALVEAARSQGGGSLPTWTNEIVFNHMLTNLREETRNDLLLGVDVRGLNAWLRLQPEEWRQAFVRELPGSLQAAVSGGAGERTRAEQLRLARRGRAQLAAGLQEAYAKEGVHFHDLVA